MISLRHSIQSVVMRRNASSASIDALYASGELGDTFDTANWTGIYQDVAGTQPVTAEGQTVRRWDSVRGLISMVNSGAATTCPTASSLNGQPTVLFDGGDILSSSVTLDFTTTDEMMVGFAARKSNNAALGILAEFSPNAGSNNGSWYVTNPTTTAGEYRYLSRGSIFVAPTGTGVAAPHSAVILGYSDISGDSAILRVNGVQAASSVADQGTGNFGNHTLFLGARSGLASGYVGHVGRWLVRGKLPSSPEIALAETWLNTNIAAF